MQYVIKICPNPECAKEYQAKDYRQKYCSHSCSARVSNGLRPKNELFCLECTTPLSKGQKKFCSRAHQMIYRNKDRIDKWRSNVVIPSIRTNGVLKQWARAYLIELAGMKCTECGWNKPNPKLGYPILTVDHIDGNWKNNKIDNLVVLCYNCHTLTPTFGALNHGSESGRREYYSVNNGVEATGSKLS